MLGKIAGVYLNEINLFVEKDWKQKEKGSPNCQGNYQKQMNELNN